MNAGVWLRLFLIVVGLVILCMTTMSLAKKHMNESFCIFWGIMSFLFIISGIVLRPVEWSRYISGHTLVMILFGGMYYSLRISKLMRQVTELTMQVSLLNQENKIVLMELGEKSKEVSE